MGSAGVNGTGAAYRRVKAFNDVMHKIDLRFAAAHLRSPVEPIRTHIMSFQKVGRTFIDRARVTHL